MAGPRFGVFIAQRDPYPVSVRKWRHYEELGIETIWNPDHLLSPIDPTAPMFEGWTTLSALAAETSRIRLGVLVSSNLLRHPALLAQQAITVDHISSGRLEVGMGCGWFEEEHRRFGIPLPEPGVRVDRFAEAMEIIGRLLRGETVTYQGSHYRLSEARLRPHPVQLPRPPLTLAAHRPRMLRIAARYADRWNSMGTPEEMAERNRFLDAECERIGRDPAGIVRSLFINASDMGAGRLPDVWESAEAFSEVVGRFTEAGVGEFIFNQPRPDQQATADGILSDLAAR